MRRGFTLVEMMFAVTITALVMGMLSGLLFGLPRVIQHAYSESELSVRMRLLRDKLLFRAEPISGSRVYAGILSGMSEDPDTLVNENRITAQALALDTASSGASSLVDQSINLSVTGMDSYLTDKTEIENRLISGQKIYFINLCAKRGEGVGEVEHRERIVVPVFGAEQKRNVTSVFHDNLLP